MLPINLTEDILKVLSKNHSIFIGKELGLDFLSIDDKKLLKNFGIDYNKLYDQSQDTIMNSYEFGQLSVYVKDEELKKLKYTDLKQYIKSTKKISLTFRDKEIIKGIKQQVQTSIRGLQGRMVNDINQTILDTYKEIYQDTDIQDINDVVLDKTHIKQIVGEISKKLKKWEYEFERIISYNTTDAFERAKVEVLLKNDGKDALVYKIVHMEACKHCHKFFLSNSLQPRIYTLQQLISNGSNIGRKVQQWKATVGPIHPWCRCLLVKVPEGMRYNPKTGKFDLRDQNYKSKKKKQRDKIEFEIGGIVYTI